MQKWIFPVLVLAILITGLNAQTLPTATSDLFSGSGNCTSCHTSAAPNVLIGPNGEDISPGTAWRASMMANASKDPLWQAKVTAEVQANPALQAIIEDKCTTCHMPMGRTEAIFDGAGGFTLAEGQTDSLSLDGVSCTVCHQIQPDNFGTTASFSGGYEITDARQIFGPYQFPVADPMVMHTGYTPVYSDHVGQSELCATCHTLFTPFVDNDGNVAGYLPEQTAYLEWQNSDFPEQGVECQTCHMPAMDVAVKISTMPPWLTTLHSPIYSHAFSGANAMMNRILKNNATELGVTASDAEFDSSFARTLRMLQENSIDMALVGEMHGADTLALQLQVTNRAGHKLPTGFPSRRAWIHLKVSDEQGNTVFESGAWDAAGEIIGLDADYEPHHNLINSADQVQIYQSVMVDVDDAVTHTLLRGARYAKDNRLPPRGFSAQHTNWDTVAVFGNAAVDSDFNLDGSGSDIIHYRIPVNGSAGNLTVNAEMCFQTVAPRFAGDLFTYDTPEVDRFEGYYNANGNEPVIMQSLQRDYYTTTIPPANESSPRQFGLMGNYPNPFNPETTIRFSLAKAGNMRLVIYDISGKQITTLLNGYRSAGEYSLNWNGRLSSGTAAPSGIYFAVLTSGRQTDRLRLLLLK